MPKVKCGRLPCSLRVDGYCTAAEIEIDNEGVGCSVIEWWVECQGMKENRIRENSISGEGPRKPSNVRR